MQELHDDYLFEELPLVADGSRCSCRIQEGYAEITYFDDCEYVITGIYFIEDNRRITLDQSDPLFPLIRQALERHHDGFIRSSIAQEIEDYDADGVAADDWHARMKECA